MLHRDNDLPAIISNSYKRWYYMGKIHRDNDLPAIVRINGEQECYYKGFFYKEINKHGQIRVQKKLKMIDI